VVLNPIPPTRPCPAQGLIGYTSNLYSLRSQRASRGWRRRWAWGIQNTMRGFILQMTNANADIITFPTSCARHKALVNTSSPNRIILFANQASSVHPRSAHASNKPPY
jgi:hypothetical protein